MPTVDLRLGDCLDILKTIPDGSVDAVVTDPPAGIGFMGKAWDKDKGGRREWIAWLAEVLTECRRVAKPGSYAFVWALPRTSHWTATAIEDAGWTVRDRVSHLFGSGFPKSKACLKPACEDWWLAWNPAKKVTPLNIDGCRVPCDGETPSGSGDRRNGNVYAQDEWTRNRMFNGGNVTPHLCRWPANIAHDGSDEVMEAFAAFGEKPTPAPYVRSVAASNDRAYGRGMGFKDAGETLNGYGDTAARFFYCSKASKADRDEGLDGIEPRFAPTMGNGIGAKEHDPETATPKRNHHPTVKPTALMRWLVRLITPPGGIVLDPFMGSGSTGKACALEGFGFVGIEQDPDYLDIARRRIDAALNETPLLTHA